MPYCPSCGSEVGKTDKYCDQCGMLIDVSETPFPKKIQSMRYIVVGLGLFLVIVGIFVFSIMPSGQSTAGSSLSQQEATGQVIAERGGSSVGSTVTTSTITVTTLPSTTTTITKITTTTTTIQPTTTTTIASATTTTVDCPSAAITIDQVYLTSGSQGSARTIVRNSGNANDLSITSAELHNTIGNVYSVSTPQIPIKDFDRGEVVTLTFDNINMPTCPSSFSKVVVQTNCPGVTSTFSQTPLCTNAPATTTTSTTIPKYSVQTIYDPASGNTLQLYTETTTKSVNSINTAFDALADSQIFADMRDKICGRTYFRDEVILHISNDVVTECILSEEICSQIANKPLPNYLKENYNNIFNANNYSEYFIFDYYCQDDIPFFIVSGIIKVAYYS